MTLTQLKELHGDNKMVSIICPTEELAKQLFGIFMYGGDPIKWGGNGQPVSLEDTRWKARGADTVYHLQFRDTGCKLFYGGGLLTKSNYDAGSHGHPKLVAIHAQAIIDAHTIS